ncbi:BMP family lipoprotein [Dehalogenimonas formicexedens]|uniref:BMP family lipoprotein n=1 Tax=Dehalogenimonas formicexedens TaxID=1839801 RepID=UPI001314259B|nr:BMP family ABC transporter substrate-binding protein [Dehalogenimonas formicexedens]
MGLLLGSGGLGDRSFNDSAYAGLLEAQKKYNIRFETIDTGTKDANIDALRLFARNHYDLIIAVAFENLESLKTVASEFPGIHFAGIDFELAADNVASVVYREQEADFLMGALAAMLTKTKKVDVIGGTDIPAIRRIMTGFSQGVAYQDPGVTVLTDFAGTFADPAVGLALALKRYGEGVDVIHNAASKTGLGIIQAAQQVNKYVTGTSGDQRYLAPGNMVGNRPKRVDTAVMLLIDGVYHDSFKPGVSSLGLKENGLALGPFDPNIVTPQISARLDDLKQKIIAGQIVVKAE